MHTHTTTILLVSQSCLTLWDPMDCSLQGSNIHEILQARILKWVAYPFSSRSSRPRNQMGVFCIAGRFFSCWAAREAVTNLYSVFKSRDIALLTKIYIVKTMVFLVVMYRRESWTIKKDEDWRIDVFKLWCWRRLLRVTWTCKEIKPVNPKGNQPWIFIEQTDTDAEAPILWPPGAKSWLIEKNPDAGKDWRQKEKGAAEDEIVR